MLSSSTVTHAQDVLNLLSILYVGGFAVTILYYLIEQLAQSHFPHLLKDDYEPLVKEIVARELYDRNRAPSGHFPQIIAMIVAVTVGISFELLTLSLVVLGYLLITYTTGIIVDPDTALATMVVFSSFVAVAIYQQIELRVRLSRTYLGY